MMNRLTFLKRIILSLLAIPFAPTAAKAVEAAVMATPTADKVISVSLVSQSSLPLAVNYGPYYFTQELVDDADACLAILPDEIREALFPFRWVKT